ncbi:hypothetical protein V7150_14205 [Neobacillus drentensis]|uniref:hypothetical protein n=1 Tax=Neobacillus drentensis TaxID=220684 RepID=UPI0030000B82
MKSCGLTSHYWTHANERMGAYLEDESIRNRPLPLGRSISDFWKFQTEMPIYIYLAYDDTKNDMVLLNTQILT